MKAIVSGGFYGSGICAHTEIASHDMKIALCLQIQTQIYQSACWQLVPSHGGVVMSLLTAIPRNNPTSTFFFGCEFQNRKTNSIFSAYFPLYLTLYHLYHSIYLNFLNDIYFIPTKIPDVIQPIWNQDWVYDWSQWSTQQCDGLKALYRVPQNMEGKIDKDGLARLVFLFGNLH